MTSGGTKSYVEDLPKIRARMSAKGISEKELAGIVDVDHSTINRYLNRKTKPRADIWDAIKRALDLEPKPPRVAPIVVPAPLVAEDVGAGEPTLRIVPGEERHYFFRPDWLAEKGLLQTQIAVYRLGPDTVAMSMYPTIAPESILLVDREANRDEIPPRSIWIVSSKDVGDRLVVKRVTRIDDHLVFESDNRDEEFAPKIVKATAKDRRHLLEGRVVWYATEVA